MTSKPCGGCNAPGSNSSLLERDLRERGGGRPGPVTCQRAPWRAAAGIDPMVAQAAPVGNLRDDASRCLRYGKWFWPSLGAEASQPVRAEPVVDSFSDGSPPGLQHHVVTHAGEEFCFGAIRARRRKYLFSGVSAVLVGA